MGAIVTGALLLIAAPGALASGCGSESGGPTGFSPAASPTWSSTTTTPTETATAGPTSSPGGPDAAALFAQQCAACHGQDGEGGVGPNLTGLSDSDLSAAAEQIRNGGGAMPAFEGRLDDDEIEALAAYVVMEL